MQPALWALLVTLLEIGRQQCHLTDREEIARLQRDIVTPLLFVLEQYTVLEAV